MLNTPSGYRLAPAFDLVPDIAERGEHILSFQYDYACPTREVLLAVAKEWQVARAEDRVDEVVEAVREISRYGAKARSTKGKGTGTVKSQPLLIELAALERMGYHHQSIDATRKLSC
jgi:hypothetical protein